MKFFSIKRMLYAFAILFIFIQFIRLTPNNGEALGQNDISKAVSIPNDVLKVLEKSCFDCHSNHTNYLWYSNIQPVGLFIQNHINEGKEKLNFSEFNNYDTERKQDALEEIGEEIKEGEMPLASYTLMHSKAKLTQSEKDLILNWVNVNPISENENDND